MAKVLITGGAGFFGSLLRDRLLGDGHRCVSVDLMTDARSHPNLRSVQGDIRDVPMLERIFSQHKFDAVFHCAAMLAHAAKDKRMLWESNVDGTANVARLVKRRKVPKLVFISSNCLWARDFHRPVTEQDVPDPAELYGKSKQEGERILLENADSFDCVILRTPTIIDCGRLGLLAILFEFIREGRTVWVVGRGANRYQFIYAPDLADACVKAMEKKVSGIFNVGSDNVQTLREVFEYVVRKAQTASKVASLPKAPTLALMRLAHVLRISPLGPYHYKMISENFLFDTAKIKGQLGWRPTLTNGQMLYRAYKYYQDNLEEIRSRTDVSAHRQPAKMGIIKLLQWVS
ncbi:MAG: NAD(P)-dependent oxidoreductase [Planctomycetes bacterium]|nr:NAD(P)-dependent oxidoreductase [Planctomycetota bacterium]